MVSPRCSNGKVSDMIDLRLERGHVSLTVASQLMGVSRQRVHQLLKAGRIVGAFLMDCGDGREIWCIPRNSLKLKEKNT
jgi:predicted DNA-binding protein (UPF0251 family)